MSARPKLVVKRPADEWAEFRPVEVSSRRRPRSAVPKTLVIATFLFSIIFAVWVFFRPQIRGTMAEIRTAMAELAQARVNGRKSRPATAAVVHRTLRPSARERVELLPRSGSGPGPFEVYLLDGDRYIRVDSSSRSVLLNMQTGEATWMDSDAVGERRR